MRFSNSNAVLVVLAAATACTLALEHKVVDLTTAKCREETYCHNDAADGFVHSRPTADACATLADEVNWIAFDSFTFSASSHSYHQSFPAHDAATNCKAVFYRSEGSTDLPEIDIPKEALVAFIKDRSAECLAKDPSYDALKCTIDLDGGYRIMFGVSSADGLMIDGKVI